MSATTATSIHIGDCCRCLPILPLVNRSSIIVSSRSALLPLLYRSSTTRGVYHLAGLLPHPSSSQPPSTSAASTICGVYRHTPHATISLPHLRGLLPHPSSSQQFPPPDRPTAGSRLPEWNSSLYFFIIRGSTPLFINCKVYYHPRRLLFAGSTATSQQ